MSYQEHLWGCLDEKAKNQFCTFALDQIKYQVCFCSTSSTAERFLSLNMVCIFYFDGVNSVVQIVNKK